MTTLVKNMDRLPLQEKIILVEDLWDSIARNNADLPVLDWQKQELARRKQSFRKTPRSVMTWQQVKKSILVQNG
jgi:putative addiction module component (TIGR02574 family)